MREHVQEIATLLHIAKEAAGHGGGLNNIAGAALARLRQINDDVKADDLLEDRPEPEPEPTVEPDPAAPAYDPSKQPVEEEQPEEQPEVEDEPVESVPQTGRRA